MKPRLSWWRLWMNLGPKIWALNTCPAECCQSDLKPCSWCSNRTLVDRDRDAALEVDDIFSAAGTRFVQTKTFPRGSERLNHFVRRGRRREVWQSNRSCFLNLKRNDIIVEEREQIQKKHEIRAESAVKTKYNAVGAPASTRSPLWKYSVSWVNTGPVFIEVTKRLFTLPALIASKQHKWTKVIVILSVSFRHLDFVDLWHHKKSL